MHDKNSKDCPNHYDDLESGDGEKYRSEPPNDGECIAPANEPPHPKAEDHSDCVPDGEEAYAKHYPLLAARADYCDEKVPRLRHSTRKKTEEIIGLTDDMLRHANALNEHGLELLQESSQLTLRGKLMLEKIRRRN